MSAEPCRFNRELFCDALDVRHPRFSPADIRALWEHLKVRARVAWPLAEMTYGMLEFANQRLRRTLLEFRPRGVKSLVMMYSASAFPRAVSLTT